MFSRSFRSFPIRSLLTSGGVNNTFFLPRLTLTTASITATNENSSSNNDNKGAVTTTETSKQVIPADIISGAPEELRYRSVRIYRPSRTAMQSGTHNTKHWRIDFDILEGNGRWENPLMGWASSADAVQALQIKFATKEDAINFAERQGWDYFVQEPKESVFHVKAYADNYKYSPGKLRLIKTK
ncbi:7218_t:CDS:2 [Ambispora gerdemannii]|uniref:NADH dehydrogenase [ubiquinone] iron-sulfur protein 4, mitochondrial n=1 Tax=Ambispora gerdemannii TaxID=144530 RepID=A0A9N9AUG4_9GLOM|nr:7218_t:CDS:2 [Ambispora gerdemannii]